MPLQDNVTVILLTSEPNLPIPAFVCPDTSTLAQRPVRPVRVGAWAAAHWPFARPATRPTIGALICKIVSARTATQAAPVLHVRVLWQAALTVRVRQSAHYARQVKIGFSVGRFAPAKMGHLCKIVPVLIQPITTVQIRRQNLSSRWGSSYSSVMLSVLLLLWLGYLFGSLSDWRRWICCKSCFSVWVWWLSCIRHYFQLLNFTIALTATIICFPIFLDCSTSTIQKCHKCCHKCTSELVSCKISITCYC